MKPDTNDVTIDLPKLFNLSANLLVAGFQRQSEEQVQKLYDDLKEGQRVAAGQLKSEHTDAAIPIYLQLDHSEYRGTLSYFHLSSAIDILLQKFSSEVENDPQLLKLHALSNPQSGELVFNIPAGIRIESVLNVLMVAVLPCDDCLVVRLIFVDPDQFDASSDRSKQAP